MAEKGFEVTGAEHVLKQLKLLETGFLNAVEEAVLKGTKMIEADAKRLVPVVSGRLARSIAGGLTKRGVREVEGRVGANTVYAAWIEFGKRVRGGKGKSAGQIVTWKGKPYLWPAVQMNLAKISQMIADGLKKTIRGFNQRED